MADNEDRFLSLGVSKGPGVRVQNLSVLRVEMFGVYQGLGLRGQNGTAGHY